MAKIFLLMVFSVLVFGGFEIKAQTTDFDASTLSKKGQKAYETILKAKVFEDAIVGEGMFSESIKAFDVLLNEKKADAAFKSLLKKANVAGKLYALCGMYFTDYPQFLAEVEKFKVSRVKVWTQSGCKMFERETNHIIEEKYFSAAIIPPSQTFKDFLKTNPQSWHFDIANGGYPASFKYFAEKEKAKARKKGGDTND